ncbi:unnamed protein product, partial [Mesorhabditis spiculigera]
MALEQFFENPTGNPEDHIDVIQFIKTLKKIEPDDRRPPQQATPPSTPYVIIGDTTEKPVVETSSQLSNGHPHKKGMEKRISASDLLLAARKKFSLSKKEPAFHSLDLPEGEDQEECCSSQRDLLRMPQINNLRAEDRKGGSEPANLSRH